MASIFTGLLFIRFYSTGFEIIGFRVLGVYGFGVQGSGLQAPTTATRGTAAAAAAAKPKKADIERGSIMAVESCSQDGTDHNTCPMH